MANIQTPIFTHSFGLAPDSEAGPRAARALIPIVSGTPFLLNLLEVIAQEKIDKIQTIYVDNTGGSVSVLVQSVANQIEYEIAAGEQAILPFFLARGDGNVTFTRAETGTLPVYFFNVPTPAIVWGGANGGTAGIIALLTDIFDAVEKPANAARTSVAAAIVDTSLLAANAARLGGSIYNDSSDILYLGLGAAAVSAADFTVLVGPGAYYEISERFTGPIRGIWAAATGSARITELS